MSTAVPQPVDQQPWEFRARSGGQLTRAIPAQGARELRQGQLRLRFLAGGVCGSDIGTLAGIVDGDTHLAPLHEVVGQIVESRDRRLSAGQIVVGTGLTGLASELIEEADRFIPAPSTLSFSEAVAIQPLATVLRAVDALPPVAGNDVVVLGAGAIGLAFVHVLKHAGASSVVVVEPVAGRAATARRYGADEVVVCAGQQWRPALVPGGIRPSLVVEAVGRQSDLVAAAIRGAADGGTVLGFGSAGNEDYPIPYGEMYHRRLTLTSGRTRTGWVEVLDRGAAYLLAHRADFADYVSHRIPVDDAQQAFDLCSRPDETRIKVTLVTRGDPDRT